MYGSTSQMIRHAERLHPDEFDLVYEGKSLEEACRLTKKKRGTLDHYFNSTVVKQEYNEKQMKDMLAAWVIETNMSFKVVEAPSFITWTSYLYPKVLRWRRRSLKSHIMKMWRAKKIEIKTQLQEVPGRLSFTTDVWTARTTEAYMCVTAHWLDKRWVLRSVVMDFVELPGSHSAIAIAERFRKCLREFGVEHKVRAITLDNASANVAAMRYLSNDPGFQFDEYWHVRCFAHVLNLAVQDAIDLPHVKHPLEKLRYLSRWINKSSIRKRQFLEKVAGAYPGSMVDGLHRDTPTRWNSALIMVEHALKVRQAIDAMVGGAVEDRDIIDTKRLTEDEWQTLQHLTLFLKAFENASVWSEADQYETIHLVLITYHYLIEDLEKAIKELKGMPMADVLEKARNKMVQYYNNTSELLTVATALDPRFKLKWHAYPHIMKQKERGEEPGTVSAIKAVVPGAIVKTYERRNKQAQTVEEVKEEQVVTLAAAEAEVKRVFDKYLMEESLRPVQQREGEADPKKPRYDFFDRAHNDMMKAQELNTVPDEELQEYLVTRVASRQTDILHWWRAQETNFPTLAAMARDVFAIPATSATSERAFSLARHVVTEFRSSLSPETIRAILCLKSWLNLSNDVVEDAFDLEEDEDEDEEDGEVEGTDASTK